MSIAFAPLSLSNCITWPFFMKCLSNDRAFHFTVQLPVYIFYNWIVHVEVELARRVLAVLVILKTSTPSGTNTRRNSPRYFFE